MTIDTVLDTLAAEAVDDTSSGLEGPPSKLLLITNLDYVNAVIPYLREYFEEGLVVVHGCPHSGSELTKTVQHAGWSSLCSDQVSLIEAVVKGFGETDYKLVIGDIKHPQLKKLLQSDTGDRVRQIVYSDQPCADTEGMRTPSWPEFAPIWSGSKVSKLRALDFATGAFMKEIDVDVTADDTAISLRFKHAEKLPELVGAIMQDDFSAGDIERMSSASGNSSSFRGSRKMESVCINQDLDAVKGERFVKAMNFPPYDPAVIRSKIDGHEYFVEYPEQYVEYKERLQHHLDRVAASPADGGPETNALDQSGGYAADTHWYSNIGGTIVKMKAEKCKMQRKDEKTAYIPGQAVGRGAKKRLRMNEPLIGLTAKYYIDKALSSKWIGVEGPYIKKFEAALAKICDVSAACAVQSGTAALYGAVKALGVDKPEHHVICPTFTCAACADAVVHAGGSPVVVDCELDSYGLSYDAVVNALNSDSNIVGIVIAPCYGVPARDHNKIYALAMEKGLWLCEDNCETYGAGMDITELQKDKTPTVAQVGSMSTISVVSVRSEKMVGVGEGGAILSKDLDLVSKARWWCSRAPVKGGGMWRVYDHEAIGQNFRLPECLGAVGLAACENLPVMIENKRKIHGWYEQYMSPEATPREELHPYLRAIKFQKGKGLDEPVWWINSIILPVNAEKVGMLLMQKFPHIEVRPAFYPLHSMNIFKEHSYPGPNADHLYESLLCLPSSAMLVEDDVKEICSAVRECLHEVVITEKSGA